MWIKVFLRNNSISSCVAVFLALQCVTCVMGYGFPKDFLDDITQSNVVKNRLTSRWKWEVWDVVPGVHTFNLYVFNVTNPDEVERGGKPNLEEVGPYVYTEFRIKFNVSINLDLSVNYERNFTYTFDPVRSKGSESDTVNVLNVPFIVFSTLASGTGNIGNEAVKVLVRSGETLIKRQAKIGDVLFNGMDVSVYKPYLSVLGNSIIHGGDTSVYETYPSVLDNSGSEILKEFSSGAYGVLKEKSGANEGIFTVDSGLKDPSKIGKIKEWKNEMYLPFWQGSCNILNGTDGTVFPPYVDINSNLEIFDIDLCRSIDFVYEKTTDFHSVQVFRFGLDKKLLADPRNYGKNSCFCNDTRPNKESCLKEGVLDVSSCREGAPYVISYPHFLNASPDYSGAVTGLHPDPKLHNTFLEVEPTIGVVIEYTRRLQWNLKVEPLPNIDYFSKFSTTIFPVIWNDDRFKLSDDKAELLTSEIANIGGYGTSGIPKLKPGIASAVLCGLMYLICSIA